MSRRRVPQRVLIEIGWERIGRLLGLAEEAVRQGNPDRARRYVQIAKHIAAKTQIALPRDVQVCRGCEVPLMPGINCRIRLGNHMVCITCGICGKIRRRPYMKEQLHD